MPNADAKYLPDPTPIPVIGGPLDGQIIKLYSPDDLPRFYYHQEISPSLHRRYTYTLLITEQDGIMVWRFRLTHSRTVPESQLRGRQFQPRKPQS